MSQMSISRDDPRVETLSFLANLVFKEPLKEAVKEALDEWEQESTESSRTTGSSGGPGSSGEAGSRMPGISGRSVAIGLALVGGAALLARRRGMIPGGPPGVGEEGGLGDIGESGSMEEGEGTEEGGSEAEGEETPETGAT